MKKVIFLIFLGGLLLRIISVLPYNTVIGFDQVRDFWQATSIFRDHHLRIIGPTAGNNPDLHHGVAFWYYIIPPLILTGGNPIAIAVWNSIFNAFVIVVMYLLARDMFKSRRAGLVAAILAAVSYQVVQFSGWISNPTVTIFTVPIFFYCLWKHYFFRKSDRFANWWLPLAFLFLGISIEFELFFIYLIPVGLLLFVLLRMRLPTLKNFFLSIILFSLATSSMIATEIKFHFAGIGSILGAGKYLSAGPRSSFVDLFLSFIQRFDAYSLNFSPGFPVLGVIVGVTIMAILAFDLVKNWKNKIVRNKLIFIIVYFFSPAVMFLLGSSNEPWFLIGRPMAVILAFTYCLIKVKSKFLLTAILIFIVVTNLAATKDSLGRGQVLLEPDASSLMSSQIAAVDYTYMSSNGNSFEINSLTNPLYINAVWSYHYYWYGRHKYGYLPTWAGGMQLYPYDSLQQENGREKYLYLLIDTTFRIPPQYKKNLVDWADKKSKILEEKNFGAIYVQKRIITPQK